MPQGNLVEVLGREVRQGSPEELMVESSPSRQRRPPCETNKGMSDEAADAAALTYLFILPMNGVRCLLDTRTGSAIKHDSTTVPTARTSWLRCS